MSFSVEGDYFETCTCDVSCPCIWLKPADKDACDVMLAWHVTKGDKDGVDLSGLNAVLAVHSPKQMTDGGWSWRCISTTAPPRAVGGDGCGLLGGAAGISRRSGRSSARSRCLTRRDHVRPIQRVAACRVAGVLTMSAEEIKGMDGASAPVITNPLFGAIAQPVTQAKARDVSYHGAWDVEYSGTNSFVTDFKYEG